MLITKNAKAVHILILLYSYLIKNNMRTLLEINQHNYYINTCILHKITPHINILTHIHYSRSFHILLYQYTCISTGSLYTLLYQHKYTTQDHSLYYYINIHILIKITVYITILNQYTLQNSRSLHISID